MRLTAENFWITLIETLQEKVREKSLVERNLYARLEIGRNQGCGHGEITERLLKPLRNQAFLDRVLEQLNCAVRLEETGDVITLTVIDYTHEVTLTTVQRERAEYRNLQRF